MYGGVRASWASVGQQVYHMVANPRHVSKMYTKIRKPLRLAGAILCLSLLGSLLGSSPVLAQEPVVKGGEVAGGRSDSIPIQLKKGEMVQGKIIARKEALRVTIDDPAGKEVQNFGEIVHGSFFYAAKTDGEHYIVITNPNRWAIGTKGYTLTYAVLPTELAPGTGSGQATGEKSIMLWVTIGTILAVALGLIIYLRQKRRKRELRQRYWEKKGRFYCYSVQQLEEEISATRRKKSELEHRLEILSKANPKVRVTLSDEDHFDFDSIESQMRRIMWDLEELDRQEERLKEVLANKKAGKDYQDLFR